METGDRGGSALVKGVVEEEGEGRERSVKVWMVEMGRMW